MNISDFIFKKQSKIGKCEYCSNLSVLRPYGKNQAMICYDCGIKPENEDILNQEMDKAIIEWLEKIIN